MNEFNKVDLIDLWLSEFVDKKALMCGLCANHGVIDTTKLNLLSPGGVSAKIKAFCICPNGRSLKQSGEKE